MIKSRKNPNHGRFLLTSKCIIEILFKLRRYITKVLGTGLGRICALQTEAVRGGGCQLRNGELYNLYCSPDFLRVSSDAQGMDRTCSTHGRDKQSAQYLVGIQEGRDQ
jgi:hypothetical protein